MKIIPCLLLTILIANVAVAADPISVDQFKKMTLSEQEKALRQASTNMKPLLQPIYLHSFLLFYCQGEDGLKRQKEERIIEDKGLAFVESRYDSELSLWEQYLGAIIRVNRRSGMSLEKEAAEEKPLRERESQLLDRCHLVHQLLLKVATSPAASALGEKSKIREIEIRERYHPASGNPDNPITEQQFTGVSKELDQLLEEIKALPSLTDEQAKKEYDNFPEDKVIIRGH
jgi:hypothetical protein